MAKLIKTMKSGQTTISKFVQTKMEKVEDLTTSHPFNQINWKDGEYMKNYINKNMNVDLSHCDGILRKGPVYSAGFINTPTGFKRCVIHDRFVNCKEYNRQIKKTKKQLRDKELDLLNMLILIHANYKEFTYDMFLDCLSFLERTFEEKNVPIDSTLTLYKTAIQKYKTKLEELEYTRPSNETTVLRWECPEFKEMLDY